MRAALVSALLLFSASLRVLACPQGYESPEALVKRARLILELQVLSVSDVPPVPTNKEPFQLTEDDPSERKNAQATVRVIKCLKGKCLAQTFTLVGGPYDSCAPFYCYLHFKPGEQLVLLSEHELPAQVKAVVVNWRGRVQEADPKALAALMDNARQSWHRQCERYQSLAPEAWSRAQALIKIADKKKTQNLTAEPYPVLTCLRVWSSNPDALPSLPLPEQRKSGGGSKTLARTLPEVDPFAGQLVDGVYHTLQGSEPILPPALAEALESRVKSHPDEVVRFNQALFEKCLVEDLYVPSAKARAITRSLPPTETFCKGVFVSFRCDVSSAKGNELQSLSYALGLADDEPDTLVWRSFGLSFSSERKSPLAATYIAPYVEKNPKRDYQFWPRLVVLLSAPDLRTSPVVEACLSREETTSRLPHYLDFFLTLRQHAQAASVLERFETLAGAEAAQAKTEQAKRQFQESLQWSLKEIHSLFTKHNCHEPQLLEHLHKLEKRASGA